MSALLSIILIGFLLGMRHATDADHVIAVTTIVTHRNSVRQAALIGALWGLGHTITIFLVGTAIILFSVVIPVRIGLTMELSVGFMLILLGVLNLTGAMRRISERFAPPSTMQTEGKNEVGAPTVSERSNRHWPTRPHVGLFHTLRPLCVGVLHGLAGSVAVALLVLTTIHNPWWALAYLLVFGFGTVAGMMLITTAIAMPIAYSTNRFAGCSHMLTVASGALSIAFGCYLSYQIGLVDGLLTAHPHWTPR